MNVLIYGNSAIENFFAKTLYNSQLISKLYLAKPNPAFKALGIEITSDGYELIKDAKRLNVDFVIANSGANEEGIVDAFKMNGIKVIGVPKKYAWLEASKEKGLEFMQKHCIKCSPYKIITSLEQLDSCIEEFSFPLVLKPDGHTKGIGVEIIYEKQDAIEVVSEFLNGKYYDNSKKIIVQKHIKGREYSLMSFYDGKELISMPCVTDYKRRYNDKKSKNTGGMASYIDFNTDVSVQQKIKDYTFQLKNALHKENANFSGCIYSGLIVDENNELYVLEYNMRIGNSEGINLMRSIKNFDKLIIDWKEQNLSQTNIEFDKTPNLCINIVPKNYPLIKETVSCRFDIINKIEKKYGCEIYFNNSYLMGNQILSDNDRLLTICIMAAKSKLLPLIIKELEVNNGDYRIDIIENLVSENNDYV